DDDDPAGPDGPRPRPGGAQPGHPARPRLGAGGEGQPPRGRAAGGDPARSPQRQARVAGGLAAAGDHRHRPDDARRRRHAGQRPPALRQGAPAGPFRYPRGTRGGRPRDHGRRGLRLPQPGVDGGRGARRLGDPGCRGLYRVPRRPDSAPPEAGRDRGVGRRGRGRDRHRRLARPRPPRRVAGPLRRGAGVPCRVRTRPPQDDPRHRRARYPPQRRDGQPRLHDGRGRLHQDLDRQGERQRHPAGRTGDGAGDPRLPPPDRARRRLQAGRRDPDRQVVARLADPDEGGARRRLVAGRSVPPRRERPAHRHRAAARAPPDRAVRRRPPPPDGV
ncbi:MAG: Deoxyribose-phosphate aldolase, partial [uncultured Thermomicrobiales bacterium]